MDKTKLKATTTKRQSKSDFNTRNFKVVIIFSLIFFLILVCNTHQIAGHEPKEQKKKKATNICTDRGTSQLNTLL